MASKESASGALFELLGAATRRAHHRNASSQPSSSHTPSIGQLDAAFQASSWLQEHTGPQQRPQARGASAAHVGNAVGSSSQPYAAMPSGPGQVLSQTSIGSGRADYSSPSMSRFPPSRRYWRDRIRASLHAPLPAMAAAVDSQMPPHADREHMSEPYSWAASLLSSDDTLSSAASSSATLSTEDFDDATRREAQLLVADAAADEDLADSQFMSFMRDLANAHQPPASSLRVRDATRSESKEQSSADSQVDKEEVLPAAMQEDYMRLVEQWIEEFRRSQASDTSASSAHSPEEAIPALRDMDSEALLAAGRAAFEQGELTEAIILLEALCSRNEAGADAFELLGLSRAENEQDDLAMTALSRASELDPQRTDSHLALAASAINEMHYDDAHEALEAALQSITGRRLPPLTPARPEETHQLEEDVGELMSYQTSGAEQHQRLLEGFLAAIQRSDEAIDAQLQVGLGLLLFMKRDFARAIECFELAVSIRPDDYRLINILGAMHASSDNSAAALDCYRRVLALRPGFVRARYNIGVSCINMRAYREAAQHFLSALRLQHERIQHASESADITGGGSGRGLGDAMSETIWNSLRMCLMMLEEFELVELATKRDLSSLSARLSS